MNYASFERALRFASEGGYGQVEHNGKAYSTDPTLVPLLKAVAGSEDNTSVAALADELMDRGDARGELLKDWLGGNQVKITPGTHDPHSVVEHRYPYGWGTPHAYTNVFFSRPRQPEGSGVSEEGGYKPDHMLATVYVNAGTKSRSFRLKLHPDKARQLLSAFAVDPAHRWLYKPEGEDTKNWLNENYPPESPAQTD